ncbi:hypothetical protein [Paenibacillus oceani]|jgi:hypothetical protein|nr:hypothetical protein [Paenibacillus oceani]
MTKKVSLADAVKQKLAEKKAASANANNSHKPNAGQQPHMKSQTHKKTSTLKRRTGGG